MQTPLMKNVCACLGFRFHCGKCPQEPVDVPAVPDQEPFPAKRHRQLAALFPHQSKRGLSSHLILLSPPTYVGQTAVLLKSKS